jgi:hypothetical protein
VNHREIDVPVPFLLFGKQICPTSPDVDVLTFSSWSANGKGMWSDLVVFDVAEVAHVIQERPNVGQSVIVSLLEL